QVHRPICATLGHSPSVTIPIIVHNLVHAGEETKKPKRATGGNGINKVAVPKDERNAHRPTPSGAGRCRLQPVQRPWHHSRAGRGYVDANERYAGFPEFHAACDAALLAS